MGRNLVESAKCQFADKSTCQNRQKVSHIICHNCQHAVEESASTKAMYKHAYYLQEVSDTSRNRHYECPRQIDTEPPWLNMRYRRRDNPHIFLDTICCKNTSHRVGVIRSFLDNRSFASNDNISSLQGALNCSDLKQGFRCKDCTEEDGEEDKEDACPSVLTSSRRGPCFGV